MVRSSEKKRRYTGKAGRYRGSGGGRKKRHEGFSL